MVILQKSLIATVMVTLLFSLSRAEPVLGQEDTSSTTTDSTLIDALRQLLEKESEGFRSCPPPYSHVLGECFYLHMYIPLMTWKQAQTFCKQAGGILAEPKHFGALVAHVFNLGMAENIFKGIFNRVWVGGERLAPNSTEFKWTSGRPIDNPVTDIPVGSGNCIMMTMQDNVPFQLEAKDCDTKTHYACQLP
ncbi:uncharacterized protein [Palaemon carinicauda]|uniref:uncharacterized protein n=1 Tax=Palaemon carinicauda TaxID=392227 RepID=UPI0035B66C49